MASLSRLVRGIADVIDSIMPGSGPFHDRSRRLNLTLQLYCPDHGGARGAVIWNADIEEPIPWRDWGSETQGALVSFPVSSGAEHMEALQRDEFSIGSELLLIPIPSSPTRSGSLSIFDQDGRHCIGCVPEEQIAEVRAQLDSGEVHVFSIWETLDGTERSSLRVMAAEAEAADVILPAIARLREAVADSAEFQDVPRASKMGEVGSPRMDFGVEHLAYEDGGQGIVLTEPESGTGIPWTDWPEHTDNAVYSAKILSAQQDFADALQLDAFQHGSELTLKLEPNPADDPTRVAVYDREGRNKVGYIPRGLETGVARWMERGVRAFSAWETCDEGQRVGLRIILVDSAIADEFAQAAQRACAEAHD